MIDIHRLADPVQGCDPIHYVRAERGIGEAFGGSRSFEEGRRDRIQRDVVRAPFHGEAFGHVS